ncbi:MAG: hypothetical protein JSR34_09130 [Proteobacteria bacterium]|nr:hypothetical protein [Pseudomonadota bacterium]
MNTFKWLLKREFWEHRGGFFWGPVVTGGIMLFFLAGTVLIGVLSGHDISPSIHAMTTTDRAQVAEGLANGYIGMTSPIYMVLAFTTFFFCLGCLFDDRKDRSVLFWKSLPISDEATVFSKLAAALVVAPLLAIGIGTVVSLAMLAVLLLGGAVMGIHVIGAVLGDVNLYLSPLAMVGMLPVYVLWALPTVGWLMLVSAWARTKPFLWAVGVPVMGGTLLSWLDAMLNLNWNIGWYWQHIVGRGLGGTVPGIWFAWHPASGNTNIGVLISPSPDGHLIHQQGNLMALTQQSWHVFATADMWIGVAVGAAMIYAAIRLRRWRDEG